jgi:hypothetical protein
VAAVIITISATWLAPVAANGDGSLAMIAFGNSAPLSLITSGLTSPHHLTSQLRSFITPQLHGR